MSHKKDQSHLEQASEDGGVEVRVLDGVQESEAGLDSEVDLVGEHVSEVAHEMPSEQGKGGQNQGQVAQQSAAKTDPALDERLLLRERLLAAAPKPSLMKKEVQSVLYSKKTKLETSIGRFKRRHEYELLSRAIAELRVLVHQMELVAHAGYEVLKEIWLKVVHRFA